MQNSPLNFIFFIDSSSENIYIAKAMQLFFESTEKKTCFYILDYFINTIVLKPLLVKIVIYASKHFGTSYFNTIFSFVLSLSKIINELRFLLTVKSVMFF